MQITEPFFCRLEPSVYATRSEEQEHNESYLHYVKEAEWLRKCQLLIKEILVYGVGKAKPQEYEHPETESEKELITGNFMQLIVDNGSPDNQQN